MTDEMSVFDIPDETSAEPILPSYHPEDSDLVEDMAEHAAPEDLDRNAAEYLLKKESRIKREMAAAVAFIDAEIAEAEAELKALRDRRLEIARPFERKLTWLETAYHGALIEWARQALAFAKTKTVKLAYGSVSFRKQADSVTVTDPEAATAWARTHCLELLSFSDNAAAAKIVNEHAPELLYINANEVSAYVAGTGDLPAGVKIVAGEDKAYVKTTEASR